MLDYDTLIFNIAVFIAAIFLLDYGADKFIDHTAIIAKRLGVSQTLIALLTAGAEWEELAVVIAAVSQHNAPLAFGNVIGSVISNILAAFSLGLLFQRGPVTFDRSSKVYVTLLLVLTPPVVVLGYRGKSGVVFGSILIVVFALYVISISIAIYRGVLAAPEAVDSDDDDDDVSGSNRTTIRGDTNTNHIAVSGSSEQERGYQEPSPPLNVDTPANPLCTPDIESADSSLSTPPTQRHNLRNHIFQLVLGFLALSISGYILSHSATSIATELNLSGTVYGITILAFATTLPEKFIAVLSARRGHSGIVVAATAGSNIFLLTLCLGVVYVSGAEAGAITAFEMAVALASVAAFVGIVYVSARWWMGVLLLLGYVAFFVLEFTIFVSRLE